MSQSIVNTWEHNYSREYFNHQRDHDYGIFSSISCNNDSDYYLYENNSNVIQQWESNNYVEPQHQDFNQISTTGTSKDTEIENSVETNIENVITSHEVNEETESYENSCIDEDCHNSDDPSQGVYIFYINHRTWCNHHNYGEPRVRQWINLIRPHFALHNNHCLLKKVTDHVKKTGSKQHNKAFFRGVAACKFKKCTCRYEFIIQETPSILQPEDYVHRVRVSLLDGIFRHEANDMARMNMSGMQRKMFQNRIQHTSAFMGRLDVVAECDLEEVLRGNTTNAPSLATCQKASGESKNANKLSTNFFQHVFRCKYYFERKYDILKTEYKPGYIQHISCCPFYISLFTELQFLYLCGLDLEIISLYLDATGTIIATPDYVNGKTMYYYAIVLPGQGRECPPLPIGEFISATHDTPTLAAMFTGFGFVLKHYLQRKGRKVDHLEMDWCFALIQSSLRAFNDHSLSTYLDLCYNILMSEKTTKLSDIHFTIVHICCAHVIKFVSKKFGGFTQKNYELFQFCMTWFAQLQVATTMTEADILLEHATNIFCSEKYTEIVITSMQELQKIINTNIPSENSSMSEKEDFLFSDENLETQRDNSPFTQHFNNLIQNTLKKLSNPKLNNTEGADNNPYYLPELVPYFQKKLLAYFPLWSGAMLIFIGKHRDTSSHVEIFFKILKYQLLLRETRIQVHRFVKIMIDKILKLIKSLIVTGINAAKKNKEPIKNTAVNNLIIKHGIKINTQENDEEESTNCLEAASTPTDNFKIPSTPTLRTDSVNDPLITVDDCCSSNGEKNQAKHNDDETGFISKPKEHKTQWSRKGIPKDLESEVNNTSETKKQRMEKNKFHNRDLTFMTNKGTEKSLVLQAKKNYEALDYNIVKTPKTTEEKLKMKNKKQNKRIPTILYATPRIEVISHNTTEIISKQIADNHTGIGICNTESDVVTNFSPSLEIDKRDVQTVLISTSDPHVIERRCTKRTAKPTKIYQMYTQQTNLKKSKLKSQALNESVASKNENKSITNHFENVQYNTICSIKIDRALLVEDLGPKRQLSDDVVDAFLLISVEKAKRNSNKHVLVIPSIFYDRIKQKEIFSPAWINSVVVLDYDLILLPIHTKEPDHWSLVLVDMKNKKITLLDSAWEICISKASVIQKNICDLLDFAVEATGNAIQWETWTLYYPNDILRQDNNYDCGVHVCIWSHIICTGLDVTYDNSHTQHIRSYIRNTITSFPQFENLTYNQLKSNITTSDEVVKRNVIPRNLEMPRTSPMYNNTLTYLSNLFKM